MTTQPAKEQRRPHLRLVRPEPAPAIGPAPRGYLWWLTAMLATATIFDGYDITILHLCTPEIAKTFALSDSQIGLMVAAVRVGAVLSFFVVILADVFGRRPLITLTVLCYTVFTLLTALSEQLVEFTVCQFLARIFLAAEFALAVVIISEEFPDKARGRGIAILHMMGVLGVIMSTILYRALVDSAWGWKSLYFVGVIPLVLVGLFSIRLKETRRFVAIRRSRGERTRRQVLQELLRDLRRPFDPRYRGRLLLTSLLWNCAFLVSAPSVTFFTLYAKRDHGWSSSDVGIAILIAYLFGTLGHFLCGAMLDRIGRKSTAVIFYVCGAVSIFGLYQASDPLLMRILLVATVFFLGGSATATGTFSAELFPTEIRATGYSWASQVFGRISEIGSPILIGYLAAPLGGLGNAVAAVAIGPIIGAVLVWRFAPETRGKTLEEIAGPL